MLLRNSLLDDLNPLYLYDIAGLSLYHQNQTKGTIMSKTKTYFYIIAAVLITIAIGYLLNIHFIKTACISIIAHIQGSALPAIAAICAFLFYGNRNYWLIITGCGIITAIVLPLINSINTSLYAIIYSCLAFMTIVFLMNLVKLLINKK